MGVVVVGIESERPVVAADGVVLVVACGGVVPLWRTAVVAIAIGVEFFAIG